MRGIRLILLRGNKDAKENSGKQHTLTVKAYLGRRTDRKRRTGRRITGVTPPRYVKALQALGGRARGVSASAGFSAPSLHNVDDSAPRPRMV